MLTTKRLFSEFRDGRDRVFAYDSQPLPQNWGGVKDTGREISSYRKRIFSFQLQMILDCELLIFNILRVCLDDTPYQGKIILLSTLRIMNKI